MYKVYRRLTIDPHAEPTLVYGFDSLSEAHEYAKLHSKHAPNHWYYVQYRTPGGYNV